MAPSLDVSGVIASGVIRTTQKRPVFSLPGSQPPVAARARLDRLATVAATDSAVGLDRQTGSAMGTGGLCVLAIRVVRAAVEYAPVPSVFPALQASIDAGWAGDIAFRQPTEFGDVIAVVHQLCDEW